MFLRAGERNQCVGSDEIAGIHIGNKERKPVFLVGTVAGEIYLLSVGTCYRSFVIIGI